MAAAAAAAAAAEPPTVQRVVQLLEVPLHARAALEAKGRHERADEQVLGHADGAAGRHVVVGAGAAGPHL